MTPQQQQQQQQPPMDDKDTIAIWNRIVRRRQQELAMLEESAAKSVLQGLHAHLHDDGSSLQSWSSSTRETVLERLLMENFRLASNAALPASKRRTAFEVLETLQRRLDEAKHSMTSKPLNSKSVVRGEGSVSAVNGTSKTALTSNSSSSSNSNSNSRIQAAALVNGTTTLSMATAPASLQTYASTTTAAAATAATTTSRVSAATTANKHRSSLTATLAAASAVTVTEAASAVAGRVVTGVSTMTMMPTTRNDPLQYLVAASSNSNSNSHLGAPPPYKRTSETVVARQAEKAANVSSSRSGSRGQSKSLTLLEENIPPPPATATAASIVATTNSNTNTNSNGSFNKNSTSAPLGTTNKHNHNHSDKKRKGREDDEMDMDISSSDNNADADADADDNVAPWAKRVATSTTIESPSTLKPTAPTSAATTAAPTKTLTATNMPHTTASTTTTTATATAIITYKERPKIPRWQRKTSTADNISTVDFGEDGCAKTKSYACAQKERRAMTIQYRKQWPNEAMVKDAGRRLEEWEPNWQIEQMVAMGVTVPVDQIAPPGREHNSSYSPNNNKNNKPFTVAEFELPELKGRLLDQIPWGKPAATGKPKDGDIALLLRMLPLYADDDDDDVHDGAQTKKQYAYSSHSRADCHLWPKGTFLTIDQKPIVLQQRKQANHDLNKWEYQSHALSLGPHLLSSSPPTRHQRNTKLAMCCYDTTQFLYSVTVCIYKCPETLTNYLLLSSMPSSPLSSSSSSSKWKLQRLTYEESLEKAMTLIHQQMVFIDDDDDDENKNKSAPTAKDKEDVGKFVFSLVDPVSRQPMKTPVRGRHCKHWQCFDLEYFMQVNAPVYGSRWRCVCCEAFVSYHELQICGLIQQALQTLAKDVSSTRDRVEFRADQTYHLLPPPTLRHAKRHSVSSGTTTAAAAAGTTIKSSSSALDPMSFEAIEIIDLD